MVIILAAGGYGLWHWLSRDTTSNVNEVETDNTNTMALNENAEANINDVGDTNVNQNTNPTAATNTNSASGEKTFTSADKSYSLKYPTAWYPHDLGDYVIFTKSAEELTLEGTEGYALGAQIITRVEPMVDADGQPLTKTQWIEAYVDETSIDGNPVTTSDVTVNGRLMLKVITPLSEVDGKDIVYYYFTANQVYSLYHYPYLPASSETKNFEQVVQTFKP
jgi:hypothetical protein